MEEYKFTSAERRFYNNPKIDKVNKDYVRGKKNAKGEYEGGYLQSWNVAKSTLAKFYDTMPYLFERVGDIKKDLREKIKIAKVFSVIHKKYSASTYLGVIGQTKKFSKWLCNGVMPDSLSKDNLKQLTKSEKKTLLRANNPDYETLEWEEGLKLADHTNSIQIKAFILTELDGGFRPSEIMGLNYGDIKREEKFLIATVKDTKTAEPRDVILYKSVPYLNRWLKSHPSKKKTDPLFVLEYSNRSKTEGDIIRYTPNAAKKMLAKLKEKSGIKKKLSMYMLRHSAVRLSKKENINPDLASRKFGHSVKFYSEVYGKTSTKDDLESYKKAFGESTKEKKDQSKPQICPVCEEINEPGVDLCQKCNNPLSLRKAMEIKSAKDLELDNIKKEMANMLAEIKSIKEIKEELMKRGKK